MILISILLLVTLLCLALPGFIFRFFKVATGSHLKVWRSLFSTPGCSHNISGPNPGILLYILLMINPRKESGPSKYLQIKSKKTNILLQQFLKFLFDFENKRQHWQQPNMIKKKYHDSKQPQIFALLDFSFDFSQQGDGRMIFLSAAIGQRPRNYLSCCSCSCCSPFGSFPL